MEHLYDTHFHLDLQKDHCAVIREIENKQIYTIAVTNLPDLYRKEKATISSKFIRLALGFHPELIHDFQNQIPLMWELLSEARYVGEVGLDFVGKSYRIEQVSFFTELVERCKDDAGKLLTIHSRRAVSTVLDILGEDFKFKPILHWFTGTKKELERAVEVGCWFSLNNEMIKSRRLLELLPLFPKDKLLLETDSPFVKCDTLSSSLKSIMEGTEKEIGSVHFWDNFKLLLMNNN